MLTRERPFTHGGSPVLVSLAKLLQSEQSIIVVSLLNSVLEESTFGPVRSGQFFFWTRLHFLIII